MTVENISWSISKKECCRPNQWRAGASRTSYSPVWHATDEAIEAGSHCSQVSFLIEFEPAHDKTYNKTCATSKDSEQPAHLQSLIRVFADRMCFLQPPGYLKRTNKNPCHTWWMYKLIWVFTVYTGLIVGFVLHWFNLFTVWCDPSMWYRATSIAEIIRTRNTNFFLLYNL